LHSTYLVLLTNVGRPSAFDLIYILKFSCNVSYFIWQLAKSPVAEATLLAMVLEAWRGRFG
jgi:hypothetical protein